RPPHSTALPPLLGARATRLDDRSVAPKGAQRRGNAEALRAAARRAAAFALASATAVLYADIRFESVSWEVSPNDGMSSGFPAPSPSIPSSRCGASEMPTRPQPTSAIGWPALTLVPTGTSAGAAWP